MIRIISNFLKLSWKSTTCVSSTVPAFAKAMEKRQNALAAKERKEHREGILFLYALSCPPKAARLAGGGGWASLRPTYFL
jgi:hypothetical protein